MVDSLDPQWLEDEFVHLVVHGSVGTYLYPDEAAEWRKWIRSRARAQNVSVRTMGRQLEVWEIDWIRKTYGDELGGRTFSVFAYLPDHEPMPNHLAEVRRCLDLFDQQDAERRKAVSDEVQMMGARPEEPRRDEAS